jgi:hypothetical protein
MSLNEVRNKVHAIAVDKGWWPVKAGETGRPSALEIHALIHSEISEATEEVRNNMPSVYVGENGKPEGEAVELADAMIRILDYFGERGWDADEIIGRKIEYNKTRSFRHGNKSR